MKKRLFLGLLALICIGIIGTGAYAAGAIRLLVNGQELKPDTPPQMISGRTMVPLRVIAEALNVDVGWDGTTKTVTIEAEDLRSQLSAETAKVNDIKAQLATQTSTATDLETQLSAQTSKNSDLETQLSAQTSKNSDLETQLTSKNTQIDILNAQITIQNTKISDLEAQISDLSSETSSESGSNTTTLVGLSRQNPVPAGQTLLTSQGIEVTVTGVVEGTDAWNIIKNDPLNDPPAADMKYVLVTVRVKNISSAQEPDFVGSLFFEMVGSSSKLFYIFDRLIFLPDEGAYSELGATLFHGGETTGAIAFYVPQNETNLVLLWDSDFFTENIRYFEVK